MHKRFSTTFPFTRDAEQTRTSFLFYKENPNVSVFISFKIFYNIILIYSYIYVLCSPKRFPRELFSFIRDGEQTGKLVLSRKTPKVSVLPHLHYVFYKMILLYDDI